MPKPGGGTCVPLTYVLKKINVVVLWLAMPYQIFILTI